MWQVNYIPEKEIFEFKYKDATGVISVKDVQTLDPDLLANWLTEMLNDLAKS